MPTFTAFDTTDREHGYRCTTGFDPLTSEPTSCPESASWWRDSDDLPVCSECKELAM